MEEVDRVDRKLADAGLYGDVACNARPARRLAEGLEHKLLFAGLIDGFCMTYKKKLIEVALPLGDISRKRICGNPLGDGLFRNHHTSAP